MESHFLTGLFVEHLEGKFWKIDKPFIYYSKFLDKTIYVPVGFVTDFASVPRLPLAYLFTGNTGHWEAVLHDQGYRWNKLSRKNSDLLFKEIGYVRSDMRNNQSFFNKKGREIRNNSMYLGVRLFGGFVYDSLPGCLDYRNKKICKKTEKNCFNCDKYYEKWDQCYIDGYYPEINKLHIN